MGYLKFEKTLARILDPIEFGIRNTTLNQPFLLSCIWPLLYFELPPVLSASSLESVTGTCNQL
jgi:hypothetical protein